MAKPEAEPGWYPAPDNTAVLPGRLRQEFEIDGELVIRGSATVPYFMVDECHLSEFVALHFGVKRDMNGDRHIGRVKIIIAPLNE